MTDENTSYVVTNHFGEPVSPPMETEREAYDWIETELYGKLSPGHGVEEVENVEGIIA